MKKKIVLVVLVLVAVSVGVVLYVFNLKFIDAKKEKAAYSVSSENLINEFTSDSDIANKKYAEKIVEVTGRVSSTEQPDSTFNIKMEDSLTGNYIIFAFQNQYVKEAKQINAGDSVTIKGSCSGGIDSEILESASISFKRCTLMEKHK